MCRFLLILFVFSFLFASCQSRSKDIITEMPTIQVNVSTDAPFIAYLDDRKIWQFPDPRLCTLEKPCSIEIIGETADFEIFYVCEGDNGHHSFYHQSINKEKSAYQFLCRSSSLAPQQKNLTFQFNNRQCLDVNNNCQILAQIEMADWGNQQATRSGEANCLNASFDMMIGRYPLLFLQYEKNKLARFMFYRDFDVSTASSSVSIDTCGQFQSLLSVPFELNIPVDDVYDAKKNDFQLFSDVCSLTRTENSLGCAPLSQLGKMILNNSPVADLSVIPSSFLAADESISVGFHYSLAATAQTSLMIRGYVEQKSFDGISEKVVMTLPALRTLLQEKTAELSLKEDESVLPVMDVQWPHVPNQDRVRLNVCFSEYCYSNLMVDMRRDDSVTLYHVPLEEFTQAPNWRFKWNTYFHHASFFTVMSSRVVEGLNQQENHSREYLEFEWRSRAIVQK